MIYLFNLVLLDIQFFFLNSDFIKLFIKFI